MQTGNLDRSVKSATSIMRLKFNKNYRQVDAEGPLVRLKNLLLNQDTLLTIAQWVTVRLYAWKKYFSDLW